MRGWFWADGRWGTLEEEVLRPGDPGALQGKGVFETFRWTAEGVPCLEQHLARLGWGALRQGCAPLPPLPYGELLGELLKRSGLPQGRARLTLRPPGVRPRLLIQLCPLGPDFERKRREGVCLSLSPFRRSAQDPTVAIKLVSRGFLDRALALAQAEGADDALLLSEEGVVLETCTANLFLIDAKGRLATTTICDAFLPGITRARVLRAARSLGWEMGNNWLKKEDLGSAREAFVTNAVLGLAPVRRLGPWHFGPGPKSLELQRILDDGPKES